MSQLQRGSRKHRRGPERPDVVFDHIDWMPLELSGGQRRCVAIARAVATRSGLLLLDDPTTGLDPITATTVDDEIVKLRDLEHVTAVTVTHQIRDAFHIASHQAVRTGDRVRVAPADETTTRDTTFMLLHNGRIQFEEAAPRSCARLEMPTCRNSSS